MRGLVDQGEEATIPDLDGGLVLARAQPELLVHRRIDGALALEAPVVTVEPLLRFTPQAPALHELLELRRRLHPRAEGLFEGVAHLLPHVDADLVEEAERTHGEPSLDQGAVDALDRVPFEERERGLVQVRPQDARGVEARAVLDDDHRLALLLSERDRRAVTQSAVLPVTITSSSGMRCTGEK